MKPKPSAVRHFTLVSHFKATFLIVSVQHVWLLKLPSEERESELTCFDLDFKLKAENRSHFLLSGTNDSLLRWSYTLKCLKMTGPVWNIVFCSYNIKNVSIISQTREICDFNNGDAPFHWSPVSDVISSLLMCQTPTETFQHRFKSSLH